MKNRLLFLLALILFLPIQADALMITPTANITIITNTIAEDGVFNFNLRGIYPSTGFLNSFSIQTQNLTGQYSLSVAAWGGTGYALDEVFPQGWKLTDISCIDDSSSIFYYYPADNSASIYPARNANIVCTVTNAKISQKTPVLIVPGIMGTEIYKGQEHLWANIDKMMLTRSDRFMDPLSFNGDGSPVDNSLVLGQVIREKPRFNYSAKLIEDLKNQQYEEDRTLFTFPYDWRKDLAEIATQNLSGQIDYILNQTEAGKATGKVDIIAHSQGGLVVKSLLYQKPEYQDKISKLVFVGTPNLGAPKAAKALLYGDSMGVEFLNMGLDPEEVKTISRNMPSVYELLPSAQYFNSNEGYLGKASLGSSGNTSLTVKTLNYEESKQHLAEQFLNSGLISSAGSFHASDFDNFSFLDSGIKTYNIIGCQTPTIGKITQKPDGSFSIDYVAGDETVPMSSASNVLGALNFYALESGHGGMLTQDGIRQQIINIIAGTNLPTGGNITPFASDCVFNGKKISVHSPVDLHIYSADGSHTGPTQSGFENNIKGVSYDVLGHEKFVFLPPGNDYTLKLAATGPGFFDFYSSQVLNGNVTSTSYFSQIPIETSSTAGVVIGSNNSETISLDLNGDGQIEQNIGPSTVLDANQSQDSAPPISTTTLDGLIGKPGFYRSDVAVDLVAIDPIISGHEAEASGVLNTQYNLDNTGYQTYSTSSTISVNTEGSHVLSFFSIDRAGNKEEPQTITFTIDKTLPEYEVFFDPARNSYIFNVLDILEQGIEPVCSNTECSAQDSAGNTTTVNFIKKGNNEEGILRLMSLVYNQTPKDVSGSSLGIEIEKNKGKQKEFEQVFKQNKKELFGIGYDLAKDISKITTLLANGKKVRDRVGGFKFLVLTTLDGQIQFKAR